MTSLHPYIHQELLFYEQQYVSPEFLNFVEEYSRIFTKTHDFQYIMVPVAIHHEFLQHVKKKSEPIYQDDQHFHYIDPSMKKSFLRFCSIHRALTFYQHVQSSLHSFLPPTIVIQNLDSIPKEIFPMILECMDIPGLAYLLPHTQKQQAILIIRLLLKTKPTIKLPLCIGGVFISNWLIQQECPFDLLEKILEKYPIRFPVRVHYPDHILCPMEEQLVEWCFRQCSMPFDTALDLIIMNPHYQDAVHFPMVYHSLRHGHPLSTTGFSVLMKKTNLKGKDLFFIDYCIQTFKQGNFDIHTWTEMGWYEDQQETVHLMMTFCDSETRLQLVIHLCMNMMDVVHVDMDYWVLRFQYDYSHYMKFVHMVQFKKEGKVTSIDERIVDFVQGTRKILDLPTQYPPFYQQHPQTIVFYNQHFEKVQLPVYADYLSSDLIDRIRNPCGFKPPLHKDIIELTTGLPDIFNNQKKVMTDWIMCCYLRHISPEHCIEEVVDLFHLSQYLMDEKTEQISREWLEEAYIREFETHMRHDKQTCTLCQFWNHK